MPDSFESAISVNTGDCKNGINYPRPDLTYLKDMADGDETFVTEIISHFLEYGPGLLESMRQSALAGDNEKLRFDAHKLLPQLTFVGIVAAIPLVTKIENESKSNRNLTAITERAVRIVNQGIEELRRMI